MESTVKTIRNARNAHWLAWFLVGAIVVLMGIGLALQLVTESPFGDAPFLLVFLEASSLCVYAIIGALIVGRHPRQPIGWISLLIAISIGPDHFAWGYASYGFIAHPGSLPGVEAMIVWLYWLGRKTLGVLGITLLLLLFPDGRPLSRRWGLIFWIALGAAAFSIPISAVAPDPGIPFPFPTDLIAAGEPSRAVLAPLTMLLELVAILCALAASLSLFIRLRRARGLERQQLKWFVFPAAFLPPAFVLLLLDLSLRASSPNWLFWLGMGLLLIGFVGMAVASAVAIFRYRLWDIDIIIRGTVIFGLLTGTLALVYFSSVVLFGQFFQTMTGQQSPLAIVLSTLAIAALFSPLHRRIQNIIDRRFYRRKYDAEKVLAAFSARLRDEVDLERLTEEILTVIEETMQPEHLSLWLTEQTSN